MQPLMSQYSIVTVSADEQISHQWHRNASAAVMAYWHAAMVPGSSASLVGPDGTVLATVGPAFD